MNPNSGKPAKARKQAAAPKVDVPAAPQAMAAPAAIATAIVETPVQIAEVAAIVAEAPAPVEAAAELAAPIQEGPTMTDTVTNTVNNAQNFAADAQNKATAMFGDFNAKAKAGVERATKMVEEMSEFNKGNIEAVVESSRVAAKAAETLGQHAAEVARKNFETATAALKTLSAAKTPTEFFQLQSEYARSTFDALVAESSKNSETLLKLAGEVFQPLSNRIAVAAEKIKIAA